MKILYALLILCVSLSFISASSINYTIIEDKVFVEISLENIENLNVDLPKDSSAIDRSENFLSYITSSIVEKSGNKILFLVDEPLLNKVEQVNIFLPEGYFLSADYPIFPKEYTSETNGRNIIILFNQMEKNEILFFYETNSTNLIYWLIGLIILVGVIASVFYKQVKKKNFTKNLQKEERRIMDFLLKQKKNTVWTKDISKELEISKVMLSRKLRNLEEKGLIKREPYGNENKISLKK